MMSRRYIIAALVVLFLLVGIVFSFTPRTTQRIQASFLQGISPFLRTGSSLQQQIRGVTEGLKTLEELESDNSRLQIENKELKTSNQLLNDLQDENNRLRRALEYRERSVFALMPARIIARDPSSWWNTVKIDRGYDDGVESDMPVLTEQGLVGKTTTVGKDVSVVVLIADENCKVAATVEGTREQGIVMGGRTSTEVMPEITLNFLTRNASLQPGQSVYSSGVTGGVFPSGILLGKVREFRQRELDGQAVIIPEVDLSSIQDVFVVIEEK